MDGMQWMASAMDAAHAQIEIAADGLANVASDGFRHLVARVTLTDHGLVVTRERSPDQGAIRPTGRRFDLALIGPGVFHVDGATTRDGNFSRDRHGRLVDPRGRALQGAAGAFCVGPDASIDADGVVRDAGRVIARLVIPQGTRVESGALEASDVDAITETLAILQAQRAFETAQKTFSTLDTARQKSAADVARIS